MLRNLSTILILLPFVAAKPIMSVVTPKNPDTIPDRYIVVMQDGASSDALNAAVTAANGPASTFFDSLSSFFGSAASKSYGVHSTHEFGTFKGFTGKFDTATIGRIQAIPNIAYIEQDAVVSASAIVNQTNVGYGLARVSNTVPGKTFYTYGDAAGTGTYAYVLDTGININHVEFEGRAVWGTTINSSNTNEDKVGHGTHCAGIIGSKTYGVAKKANLIAVKVLGDDGTGSASDVISGMQWAVQDAQNNKRVPKSVVNMSLGGGFSQALNDAAKAVTDAGLFLAVAAGNNNADAKDYSPASQSTACTVGAIDSTDKQSSFSNFGSLLDIYAPGNSILSTYIGSTTATATLSGTSMAAPFVAGLAAYLLSISSSITPANACNSIVSLAQSDKLSGLGAGSPNKLLYNAGGKPIR